VVFYFRQQKVKKYEVLGRNRSWSSSSKLLLVLASTVVIDFETRRYPWPNFYSFQDIISFDMARTANKTSPPSIRNVACVVIATSTRLPSRYLAEIGRCTDRQQGDLISLLLFFRNKESRIETDSSSTTLQVQIRNAIPKLFRKGMLFYFVKYSLCAAVFRKHAESTTIVRILHTISCFWGNQR
jgi:hypothetical protein